MTALQVLYLEDNSLTGTIPVKLGNLTNLTQLVLSGNSLSGPIPTEVAEIPGLAHLMLRDMDLTGQIPRALSQRTFTNLGISGNAFTGCLPTGLDSSDAQDLWRPELAALPSCAQVFGDADYTFTIARNAPAGTTVGSISATAYQTGDEVTYSFANGNEDPNFSLDTATRAITAATALTGNPGDTYSLTVKAHDPHNKVATATVTINLE